MNAQQLADILNGSEYPFRLAPEIRDDAKAAGLVIVYGASDDLIEFDGAFRDEVGCGNGTNVLVNRTGALDPDFEDDECSAEQVAFLRKTSKPIHVHWDEGEYAWKYTTPIKHAEFDILEDGEKYCRAMVINIDDISMIKDKQTFDSCLELGIAIEEAAGGLPEGAIIQVSIERGGYGCALIQDGNETESDSPSLKDSIRDLLEESVEYE